MHNIWKGKSFHVPLELLLFKRSILFIVPDGIHNCIMDFLPQPAIIKLPPPPNVAFISFEYPDLHSESMATVECWVTYQEILISSSSGLQLFLQRDERLFYTCGLNLFFFFCLNWSVLQELKSILPKMYIFLHFPSCFSNMAYSVQRSFGCHM